MAKRKKLVPPTADELAALEEGFARETGVAKPGLAAPIAQVAADAAAHATPGEVADRAAAAADAKDAAAYRAAVGAGQVIRSVPLGEIATDQLTRDRMTMDSAALEELKLSIRQRGVRLPLEVFALPEERDGRRFGLLSGYRRYMALSQLFAETGDAAYQTAPVILREDTSVAQALVAMVEENEIRESLSQYERGRVAALAAAQGAFADVDAAINALFFAASKAKRSKVRSFALIHEELGDLLAFPQALTERMGLRLSSALRDGFGPDIREALATGQGGDAESEWAQISPLLEQAENDDRKKRSRGGRRSPQKPRSIGSVGLPDGAKITAEREGQSVLLRLPAARFSDDAVKRLLETLAREIS